MPGFHFSNSRRRTLEGTSLRYKYYYQSSPFIIVICVISKFQYRHLGKNGTTISCCTPSIINETTILFVL